MIGMDEACPGCVSADNKWSPRARWPVVVGTGRPGGGGIAHRRRGWQGGGITEALKHTEATECTSVPSVLISGISGSQPVLAPHFAHPLLQFFLRPHPPPPGMPFFTYLFPQDLDDITVLLFQPT